MENDGMFRFTVWLPCMIDTQESGRIALDADLSRWESWFAERGVKTEVRRRDGGQIALFREGKDAFDRDYTAEKE